MRFPFPIKDVCPQDKDIRPLCLGCALVSHEAELVEKMRRGLGFYTTVTENQSLLFQSMGHVSKLGAVSAGLDKK